MPPKKEFKNHISKQTEESHESSINSNSFKTNFDDHSEECALYKYGMDYAGDPIIWTDSSAHIVYANNATSKLLGYSREELLKMTVHDLDIEFPKKEWPQSFNMLKQHKVKTIESRYRCKNSRVIPVGITGNYLEFRGKEYNHVSFRDLSERKALEDELHKSKQRYQTIYRQAADGIVLINIRDGSIVDCNTGFEKLAGRKIEELRKMKIWEARPPEQIKLSKQVFCKIKKKGFGGSRGLDYQKPDGVIVHTEFTSSKIQIEDNYYLQYIVRDITHQKRLEKALEESEKKYRKLFKNANDALVLWQYQGEGKPYKIIEANRAACKLFEYNHDELICKTSSDVNTQESLSRASKIVPELFKKGHATYELIHLSKRGREILTEVSGHFFILDSEKVILSIIRDISKRKESEKRLEEIHQCEKMLRHNLENEMQHRIQFTRALVHELKTPLTPIIGMSSMLIKRLKDPQNIAMATSIKTSGEKLNKRIGELLDLAKGEVGILLLHYQWLDIGEGLNNIFNSIQVQAQGSGHILVNAIPNSLPQIKVDKERFLQIVYNLLHNSLKYTKPGSEIILGASADNEQLTVFIRDNGPGIPKAQQKRIFEAYQQLEADRGRLDGLGLGLSLSKKLVELHGGKIWLESKVGRGSTFYFSIPLVDRTEGNGG